MELLTIIAAICSIVSLITATWAHIRVNKVIQNSNNKTQSAIASENTTQTMG